jgi:tetratricopeptide (TPR) repeat protein
VEALSGDYGETIPYSTLARVERGVIDPGIRRLHVLLRLYGVPLSLAGDMLDLELVGRLPRGRPEVLQERGLALWREGRTRDALKHFFAVRREVPDDPTEQRTRQRALLSFAVAAGSLGKRHLAREIVDGLLAEPPHPELTVPVFLEAAVCWYWLGGKQTSLAFLDRAEKLVGRNPQHRAWIAHHRATNLIDLGQLREAAASVKAARDAYRAARDAWGASKLRATEFKLELTRQDFGAALRVARSAKREAAAQGFARLATLRGIEEGQALFLLKRPQEALRPLAAALSVAEADNDALAQFYAHYWRWRVFDTLRERDRAGLERESARHFSRFMDDVTPEVLAVRTDSKGGRA